MAVQEYEFWFVVGSQFLYGPEVLETVAARAAEMTEKLNASGRLPCRLVYKVTAKTQREIADVVREYAHGDTLVLAEGEKVCAVSCTVLLR